jgi:hypothetical protein
MRAPERQAKLGRELDGEAHHPAPFFLELKLREGAQEELERLPLNGHRHQIQRHAVDPTDAL